MEGLRSDGHRIQSSGHGAEIPTCPLHEGIPAAPPRQTVEQLLRAIREEILPRLLVAHPGAPRATLAAAGRPTGEDVLQLSELVLHPHIDEAFALVLQVAARGVAVQALFSDLLAPAAKRLGRQWEDDERDFSQVTCGLARLHQLMTRLAQDLGYGGAEKLDRSILLAPMPGDQHWFGVTMVAEFFRYAGWTVEGGPGLDERELLHRVRSRPYTAIGLSLYVDTKLESLGNFVRDIVEVSMNREIGIFVGGHIFSARHDLAERVGAHAMATDAPAAVERAEALYCAQTAAA